MIGLVSPGYATGLRKFESRLGLETKEIVACKLKKEDNDLVHIHLAIRLCFLPKFALMCKREM
jgi:hypothetical protein